LEITCLRTMTKLHDGLYKSKVHNPLLGVYVWKQGGRSRLPGHLPGNRKVPISMPG